MRPYLENTQHGKRLGVECLPSKREALSSNSISKEKKGNSI
jgi:hypothetical protein